MNRSDNNIFSGIVVLDVTKVLSGPLATRYLADYGATVIKVEHPEKPDDSRNFPPLKNNWSGYFEMLNRNKEGVTLDFERPQDRNVFYQLCKKTDVVVENLTPGSLYKLKIDYDTLKKINRKLIYASISGVDQKSNRKYYDISAQAESGLLSLSGTPDNPMKIGPAVVDTFAGVNLAFAIASALFYRERTGKGQNITVSMLGAAVQLLEQNIIDYSVSGKNPVRPGRGDAAIAPFGLFKTKDGFITIACGNEKLWNTFQMFLLKHKDFDTKKFLTNSLRLKNNVGLTFIIEEVFAHYKTTSLIQKIHSLSIPFGKVNEMSDIAHNRWFFENGSLVKLKHNKLGNYITPGRPINFSSVKQTKLKNAPELGSDNKKYGL